MNRGRAVTLGKYFATWTSRYPRSERTNATNEHRIGRVLDVEIEGTPLANWLLSDLRRRHTFALVDHMLRVQVHCFAAAAGRYEAMVRVFTDTGMRLGEVLPLRREDFDGTALTVRRTAHEGTMLARYTHPVNSSFEAVRATIG